MPPKRLSQPCESVISLQEHHIRSFFQSISQRSMDGSSLARLFRFIRSRMFLLALKRCKNFDECLIEEDDDAFKALLDNYKVYVIQSSAWSCAINSYNYFRLSFQIDKASRRKVKNDQQLIETIKSVVAVKCDKDYSLSSITSNYLEEVRKKLDLKILAIEKSTDVLNVKQRFIDDCDKSNDDHELGKKMTLQKNIATLSTINLKLINYAEKAMGYRPSMEVARIKMRSCFNSTEYPSS